MRRITDVTGLPLHRYIPSLSPRLSVFLYLARVFPLTATLSWELRVHTAKPLTANCNLDVTQQKLLCAVYAANRRYAYFIEQ